MPLSAFDSYLCRFTLARQLNRQHHFYVGPTNSGKTYQALETLRKAASGVYLAPLRLLAMEVRDRLMQAGVPCNLVTGEERVMVAGAKHTASTIEMLRPDLAVDVAVIDEIQMLMDPDRGSAWTAALVGVPAKQVFICGANSVTESCTRVLDALNEPYTLTYLQRMTPLVIEDASICGERYHAAKLQKQLQAGDAIIAFSRKDVLTLTARIRQWGFQIATIYGALSPEVRRGESSRFASGEAQILVATDAIGMGLNLPIRRVIFANIHKFDGVAPRPLNATEMRQIAGRAGRHGLYETGFVTVLEDDEQWHLNEMLNCDDTVAPFALPIAGNGDDIEALSQRIPTWRLAECMEYLHTQYQRQLGTQALQWQITPLQHQQALLIDETAPQMAMRDKYRLMCAPLAIQVPIARDYFVQCIQAIYHHQLRPLPMLPEWLKGQQAQYLEQAELICQHLSLYSWLGYQYPQIFPDGELVNEARKMLNVYISRALKVQAGYGKTQRETELAQRR
ncbi:ATP-dependent RNA helicase SUPV3L1/SUV3 [Methylophilus rhizosphaerae]|uniref:ATP-dependent RNA helicase SUPV3L1/SUV3 n=1 Tax=Methylophilus rhizosphaerae TaxID=492660 RepID=A0A1G9AYL8_9PROT|nr:helicase-related protein [Methylophilus rhizosphaerae]SDK32298.1 ATP-dependent RNA helicase SUPV3L1/SUV3 [Methylophilus rhizosphaerae]